MYFSQIQNIYFGWNLWFFDLTLECRSIALIFVTMKLIKFEQNVPVVPKVHLLQLSLMVAGLGMHTLGPDSWEWVRHPQNADRKRKNKGSEFSVCVLEKTYCSNYYVQHSVDLAPYAQSTNYHHTNYTHTGWSWLAHGMVIHLNAYKHIGTYMYMIYNTFYNAHTHTHTHTHICFVLFFSQSWDRY